jgi:hypothetical protein
LNAAMIGIARMPTRDAEARFGARESDAEP